MNLHEYQAKELLRKVGVPIPPGEIAHTPDEAEAIAKKFGTAVMVKAQVHVGGRGKAGGVKFCKTPADAKEKADDADFLEPAYLPAGVADDQGKVGYLANFDGGIDAVDLESGNLLWHSDAAAYPMVIYKGRLWAQERLDVHPTPIVALNIAENIV